MLIGLQYVVCSARAATADTSNTITDRIRFIGLPAIIMRRTMLAPAIPFLISAFVCIIALSESTHAGMQVGVASVDITPDYPVRLSGFGFRRAESEGVTQRIWAKAIAFADDADAPPDAAPGPAVILTVDNLGVPISMTREVARRLGQK